MEPQARSQFEQAAYEAGLNESELASRILGAWAQQFLSGQAEVPPASPAPGQTVPRPDDGQRLG